jgi:tRNA dimethylallyltransferase
MAALATPLLVIVGPTASGKTALAIQLAKQFNGEIICADSRTIYKGMNIGTAKPNPEERAAVPHHLLDLIEPDQSFNVADFQRLAKQTIDKIHSRGKLPILVGGSGLYIDSVIFDYDFAGDTSKRDPQNPRHRAPSESRQQLPIRPGTLVFGMQVDPQELRGRIADRVQNMCDAGLLNEVKGLAERYSWDLPAMQAPAYKAFRGYLEGTKTLDRAASDFATFDCQLAKKQRTWFKRNNSIHWIIDPSKAVDLVTTFLSNA